MLLTDTQLLNICKAFANGSSANVKFPKPQLPKMIQLRGILGEVLVALPCAVLKVGTQELIKRAPESTRDATKVLR